MVVRLRDGHEVRGVVAHHDPDVLEIAVPAGPAVLVQKAHIGWLGTEDGG